MPGIEKAKLLDGSDFLVYVPYSIAEAHGVSVSASLIALSFIPTVLFQVLVVVSCFSLIAVIGLIGAISVCLAPLYR